MFKLQRLNKQPSVSKERVDFSFSNFQVLQVPKGCDRLSLSVISVETGKATVKLGKVLVRNGSCQWPERLLESVWISQDKSLKETTECYFKFVVSTGAAKSGILGEVILNMVQYMSSEVSASVSLPLKRCNYGTIFQVKIQCLTPRTKLRVKESNYSEFPREDEDIEYHDAGSISNGSDHSFAGSVGSSSSQNLGSMSNQGKLLDTKGRSCSVSSSNRSFDRADGPTGRGNILISDDASSTSSKSCYDSRALGPRENLQRNGEELAVSSLKISGSAKTLLETAEATIEELRAEAKMWERNARKLMLDLDLLNKEFSDQSKKQADLVMELSAAYAEHEGLKKEIENLKHMLEESKVKKISMEDTMLPSDGLSHIQKELEEEIKYQRESNANLALQLKRSQESNIELVTVLQELEQTIEQQRTEIENLSALCMKLNEVETSTEGQMEDNQHLLLKLEQLQESENTLKVNIQALEKALEDKTSELDNKRYQNSQSLLDIEREYNCKLSLKEEEIARLKAKLSDPHTGLHCNVTGQNNDDDVDLVKEIESLREKLQELERDCNELTDENLELLLKLKESNNNHISSCASFRSTSTELLAPYLSTESEVNDDEAQRHCMEYKGNGISEEKLTAFEAINNFPELIKQIEMVSHHVKKPWYGVSPDASEMCKYHLDDLVHVGVNNVTALYAWVENIGSYLFELNKLLETKITECEEKLEHGELEIQQKVNIIAEDQMKLQHYSLMVQEYESSKSRFEADCGKLQQKLSASISEVGELKSNLLNKKQENDLLIEHEKELQAEVADLLEKKNQLEGKLQNLLRESDVTSKSLDNLQTELSTLRSSLDSHVSANKDFEEKLSEMANEKCELEYQILELEKENVRLKEQIFAMESENVESKEQIRGLESQLRYLAVERETCHLELESSKNVALGLQNDIRRLENLVDAQKTNLERELQDIQQQYLGIQLECERLKAENQKLESSLIDLTEVHNTLQKSNAEMTQEKLELIQVCARMEAHLDESQRRIPDCSKKIDAIEENLSSTMQAFSLEERHLKFELETLLEANRKDMERLDLEGNSSNQLSAEVENLQQEVEQLNKKIVMIYEEKQRIASEAADELSCVLSDKARIERELHEAVLKIKSAESELDKFQVESEKRVQCLTTELASVKQSHEAQMYEHKKVSKLLTNYRTAEGKLKTAINDLELKLTVSDYERQQLIEQVTNMKIQMQKLPELEDEVTILKSALADCRSEKGKLESALHQILRDHEDLKTEKILFTQKISNLEEAMSDFENCREKRMALEEKLLQTEGYLYAKETPGAHNADLSNKLSEMRRANEQYEQKIHQLQQEKDDYLKRAQALEENLRLMKEKLSLTEKSETNGTGSHQASELLEDLKNPDRNSYEREDDDDNSFNDGSPETLEMDHSANMELLERSSTNLTVDGEVVAKQRYERTKSSLERELRELRERYSQMSLQYAEVEAQREDLVMKLKSAKTGRRWFS